MVTSVGHSLASSSSQGCNVFNTLSCFPFFLLITKGAGAAGTQKREFWRMLEVNMLESEERDTLVFHHPLSTPAAHNAAYMVPRGEVGHS